MSGRLAGKVIMVTGASSGMGAATADRLAREGASVVLVARRTVPVPDDRLFVPADVTVESDVERAVRTALDRFGRLDGAFNNAGGVNHTGPLETLDDRTWQAEIAQNLTSVFYCLRHQVPAIAAAGGGSIVNNGSIAAVTGVPGMTAYTAAKHGVVGLTRSVALEWADRWVRVNALVTGNVDTPLYRRLVGMADDDPGAVPAPNPTGRVASGDEIAAFVAFLLSDDAAFITGAELPIDGGSTAQ
jgi:NAD(P)-dependent dehydrogenase (short-subunit alcohol dehydrogenase family)